MPTSRLVERLRIEKSVYRSLVVTVRADWPLRRRYLPRSSAIRRSSACRSPRSSRSRSKVSSTEIEIRSLVVSSRRGSIPCARSRRVCPTCPGSSARRSRSESAASAPIVVTPAAASRSSARGPTPGRARTANGARKAASVPAGTTVIPPGLRRSEATLATTFVGATPSEHERLVAALTEVCTAAATARAREKSAGEPFEVEVALVETGALDERYDLTHGGPDRLRVLAIERVPWADEDGLGAAAQCLGAAHRRVDSEAARDVVRGRDDSAALAGRRRRRAACGAAPAVRAPPRRRRTRRDRGERRIAMMEA